MHWREMKTRIKVHQSLGYKGYFWEVQGFFPLTKDMEPSWYGLGRGGYALTMWGAKMAARRKIKQREHFNATNKEWIFE